VTIQINSLRGVITGDAPAFPGGGDVAAALREAQIESLRTQVPVLLAVAGLNTGILMAVCAHAGMAFSSYGWMALLILYTLVRGRFLQRQFSRELGAVQQERLIRSTSRAATLMLSLLGVVAAASYASGLFGQSLLVPMSLGFGSISIAHCLYRLRRVALGALALGIGPSALTLIAVGDFQAKMLGVSMLSVALLMMRYVNAQYDQLIENLQLQHRIMSLANSDPLTGLANRRAVTDFLERRTSLAGIALALIDLDDFKQVNDRHGHDVGDQLLQHVAMRLREAAPEAALVGRLGGDEFVVIAEGVDCYSAMTRLAAQISARFAAPVVMDQLTLRAGASVGHAVGAANGDSAAALMKRADDALYAAKRSKPAAPERRLLTA
jgi:diguanylate cyclase